MYMFVKKGQVTVFIIIGILLLAMVGLVYYFRAPVDEFPKEEAFVGIAAPVKLYVDLCVEETLSNAVVYVGMQGGYFVVPEPKTDLNIFQIPYYMELADTHVPNIFDVQGSLQEYITFNLNTCLNNFASFEEQGYTIDYGVIDATVTISEKRVVADVEYPITVSFEGSSQEVKSFRGEVNAEVKKALDASAEFIEFQKERPLSFVVSDLNGIMADNGLTFEKLDYGEGKSIFSFINEATPVGGNPFFWVFAVQYLG